MLNKIQELMFYMFPVKMLADKDQKSLPQNSLEKDMTIM